ncbi:MAG: hypothetical protein HF973_17880 [Chloroflexi bacterium]|nr:hypothetical protein [Chloroflexota bacterium]
MKSESAGLQETIHLLRSRKNAERLLSALAQAQAGQGKPQTIAELRRETGLADVQEQENSDTNCSKQCENTENL